MAYGGINYSGSSPVGQGGLAEVIAALMRRGSMGMGGGGPTPQGADAGLADLFGLRPAAGTATTGMGPAMSPTQAGLAGATQGVAGQDWRTTPAQALTGALNGYRQGVMGQTDMANQQARAATLAMLARGGSGAGMAPSQAGMPPMGAMPGMSMQPQPGMAMNAAIPNPAMMGRMGPMAPGGGTMGGGGGMMGGMTPGMMQGMGMPGGVGLGSLPPELLQRLQQALAMRGGGSPFGMGSSGMVQ